MKRNFFLLSAAICASAAIAQIPDTSPKDLSGANSVGATTADAASQSQGTTQVQPLQAPAVPAAQSSGPSGQGDSASASAVAEPSSVDGGSRPLAAGGYRLGGGNVFGADAAQSSGMSAGSNGDAASGTPPANSGVAANRSAGDSRTASSTASGQDASAGNAAKPRMSAEDCRAYARHRGDAAQAGQTSSSSGQAADPCAGLDQNAAH